MNTLPTRLQLLTLSEAARLLRMSVKTVQRRIEGGAICAVRDGRKVAVPMSEIERYLADHRT